MTTRRYFLVYAMVLALASVAPPVVPHSIAQTDEQAEVEALYPSPIRRANPRYPISLARRGIEGNVMLECDIDERGRPINIEVVNSNPSGAFDAEAINTLRRFRFEPLVVDGEPVIQEDVRYGFEFRLGR